MAHSHREKVEAKAKNIKEMWKRSKKNLADGRCFIFNLFRTYQIAIARIRFRIRICSMTVNKSLRNFVFYVTFDLFWLVGCSSFGVWCLGGCSGFRVWCCGDVRRMSLTFQHKNRNKRRRKDEEDDRSSRHVKRRHNNNSLHNQEVTRLNVSRHTENLSFV